MGLIQAALNAAGTVLGDQWKEYFYCEAIDNNTLVVKGQKKVSGFSSNRWGADNIISKGSVVAVADGQCMVIVDNGKIAELCAVPGEFVYDSSTEPSIFAGDLGDSVMETFKNIGKRFTFGGEAPKDQRVYYFNTKELVGNKYGTPTPVPFRVVDNNIGLDMEVSLRCFGTYSYRICDPVLFYKNVCGNISSDYTREQLDGQLKSGRDVILMALLGADEFGFGTLPLIVLGCVMMRKCSLNTCPTGVATQNPELRSHFTGRYEYLVNYFRFLAREVREYLAEMGFRRLEDIIGHTELLSVRPCAPGSKASKLDFSRLLFKEGDASSALCHREPELNSLPQVLDNEIVKACQAAIEWKDEVNLDYVIRNTDRALCTMLSGRIAQKYGEAGLPDSTINIKFKGSAGQSFGAFLVKGVNLRLEGECNDYFGKGLSGGRISILPPVRATFAAEENMIAGNTGLYGATSGELYVNGQVGQRFAVRNSGATAVVEGAGDHCCEYMTGGRVVVLGRVGQNFAAGMSGGVAYVLDRKHDFDYYCNMDMVEISLVEDGLDRKELHELIRQHYLYTGSHLARTILDDWNRYVDDFIKVIPIEYKHVLQEERLRALQEKVQNIQLQY